LNESSSSSNASKVPPNGSGDQGSIPLDQLKVEEANDSQTPAKVVSRSEEVWGGKPWKSSVMEIGGEVLCSQFSPLGFEKQ